MYKVYWFKFLKPCSFGSPALLKAFIYLARRHEASIHSTNISWLLTSGQALC